MCCNSCHNSTSMIILNRDAVRVAIVKNKGDTPPCVYRHRPLTLSVSRQRMEANGAQSPEGIKGWGGIQSVQEHQGTIVVKPTETTFPILLEQATCLPVTKRPDH